jgi:adenine deaminase
VAFDYPKTARDTVKLGRALVSVDFDIHAPKGADIVTANVIGMVENQAPTRALQVELPVRDGLVRGDRDRDVCQIALVERHRATGGVVNGFVSGFGYKGACAVASTVAHDSHHMIVFKDGKEIALVELPIAGLMSDEPAEIVAEKAQRMVDAMAECGCTLNNAYMQHSLLALVVIPELRISDLGLVDVRKFEFVELFA